MFVLSNSFPCYQLSRFHEVPCNKAFQDNSTPFQIDEVYHFFKLNYVLARFDCLWSMVYEILNGKGRDCYRRFKRFDIHT